MPHAHTRHRCRIHVIHCRFTNELWCYSTCVYLIIKWLAISITLFDICFQYCLNIQDSTCRRAQLFIIFNVFYTDQARESKIYSIKDKNRIVRLSYLSRPSIHQQISFSPLNQKTMNNISSWTPVNKKVKTPAPDSTNDVDSSVLQEFLGWFSSYFFLDFIIIPSIVT